MITVSPIDFPSEYVNANGVMVSYVDITEVCQGGPAVGKLKIGDAVLKGFWFGGPLLFWNDFIIVPLFERPKFRIALVDMNTLQVTGIVGQYDVVVVSEVRNNLLLFYPEYFISEISKVDLMNYETVEVRPFISFWDEFKRIFRREHT